MEPKNVVHPNVIIQISGCQDENFWNNDENTGIQRRPNKDVDLMDTTIEIRGGSVEHRAAKHLSTTAGPATTIKTPSKRAKKNK